MTAGRLRRVWKFFRPKESLLSMSTKEAEARLVPDSRGVELLESGDGKLADAERDDEQPSS